MEYKDQGNRAFQAGDWRTASELYSRALTADPNLLAARANRAACSIHLGDWEFGRTDCETALESSEITDQLRLKLLWRDAICLRNLGRDRVSWEQKVAAGLALDPHNQKLLEEQSFIFVQRVRPAPFEFSESGSVTTGKPAPPPGVGSVLSARTPGFFPPRQPLNYSGVIQLTRSRTPEAYNFWYEQVTPEELTRAHATAGIDPDTLDYLHEMIAKHPHEKPKNRAFLQVLSTLPRYATAQAMASRESFHAALAAAGMDAQFQ